MSRQTRVQIATMLIVVALIAVISTMPGARAAAPTPLMPGTYATTITLADIPDSFPVEAIPILTGDWELEFTEDGSAFARKAGLTVVTGEYVANPARLILRDEGGPLACVDPGTAAGVYALAIHGDRVTASEIHDKCTGRNLVLTVRAWQRLP